jgi:hypothetical protein
MASPLFENRRKMLFCATSEDIALQHNIGKRKQISFQITLLKINTFIVLLLFHVKYQDFHSDWL